MKLRATYWVPALAVSALVHAGVVGVWPQAPLEIADQRAAGELDRIAIAGSLSDAIGQPLELGAVDAEAETEEWVEPVDVGETAEAQTVEPAAVQEVSAARPESVPAVQSPAPSMAVEPLPLAPSAVAVAAQSQATQVLEPTEPATEARPVEPEPVIEPRPVRQKVAKPKPKPKPAKARRSDRKPAKAKPARRGTAKQTRRAGQGQAASRAGTGGRSTTAAGRANLSSYLGRVASRVQRQKRYPPSARRARASGTAVVSFVINRSGAVSRVRLNRGSGHAALDQEVLAMVRRAGPFPPIPADVGKSRLSLSIPVRFSIR